MAYGLLIRKISNPKIEQQVQAMAEKLGVTAQLKKRPHELSGGQKQRVSFGRALIVQPNVILLDEPFGSLDSQTRTEMQQLFNTVRKELKITSVFVTHDYKESILMGDRIALMENGVLRPFKNLEEFVADPSTGVKEEMDFWRKLMK
jgi:putrescine transport system ATP-binding protein